jgi:hypothetical protein
MRPIIDPEEDYLTIVAAEESIAASEAKRRKHLEEAHANLKGAYLTTLYTCDVVQLRSTFQDIGSRPSVFDETRIRSVGRRSLCSSK